MYRLTVFKFPVSGAVAIVFFILSVFLFLSFVVLVSMLRTYLREKKFQFSFEKEAKDRGLTDEQIKVLWEYSRQLGRDPFLSLEFKAPFERVVDLYLKTDPNPDEELVRDMRSKLGFDYIPYFVPLTCTKDIELFQPAKLILPEGGRADVALYDKDEKYMYWAVIEGGGGLPELVGRNVKIQFVRRGDAIYTVEGPVEDAYFDAGKLVVKIPHTFEMSRYQRREYARVEVELPAALGVYNKKEQKHEWVKAEIVDISAGGVKICVPLSIVQKELPIGMEVLVAFEIGGYRFRLKSTIVNFYPRRNANCYGLKFENIKNDEQKIIHDFVKKEQHRLAQLMLRRG